MEEILVLMSTYNGERYLKEQIDSILAQEGCRIKILIRDDGSTDGTQEIIRQYIQQGAPIELLADSGKNLRAPGSFLRLVKEASDEYSYYAFADQDDVWDHDKLLHGIRALKDREMPMLYCANARLVDGQMKSLGVNVYKRKKYTDYKNVILTGNYMGCTMVFNHALKEICANMPELELCHMHDTVLMMLCILHGGTIVFDETAHMNYRQTGNNTIGVALGMKAKIKEKLNIFDEKKIWRCKQCSALLNVVKDGDPDVLEFLKVIAELPEKRISRIKVLFDPEIKYENFAKRIEVMMRILTGRL